MAEWTQGNLVRLKNDPNRIGNLTGAIRQRADTSYFRVQLLDGGAAYYPEYELELITEDHSDPFTLLERGMFGRVRDLRRQLTHIQLSGRLANIVYGMDAGNIDFYAYQYKPVLSFLESPAKGLLIADEVGLGKTIEAGLIWTELRLRYDARRLLVVCPAMLREKWQMELQRRFGVEATIMNAQELHRELQRNKGEIPDGKAIICSTQGLRPPRDRVLKRPESDETRSPRKKLADFLLENADAEPLVDLLIVDEAHHMRNPDSQTAKLGQILRDVSDNVILLSATPINLRSDDLFHLLNLVDPDTFYVKYIFPQVLQANRPLLKAQNAALNMNACAEEIKSALTEAKGHPILAKNRQLAELLGSDLTPEMLESRAERVHLANQIERINLLRHVLTRTRKSEVTEWRVVRRPNTVTVELTVAEEDFYQQVTEAIRDYALSADISDGFLLATPQRQMSSCMAAAASAWKKRMAAAEDLVWEDLGIEVEAPGSIPPLIQHLVDTVLPKVNVAALRSHDSKYREFRDAVREYLQKHPGEKLVVFSYFRETLGYLAERLAEDGIKVQVLVGGMRGSKQEVIDSFRESGKSRVLLTSEVACEGVDIQFCRVLINYDLPWNPMRVDQRIGRIDRLGQKADVITIINFCYGNTIDERIYDRLFTRLKIFEHALGGMEAILGEQISHLASELLLNKLTPAEESARIEQTAMAIERIQMEQEELESQASNLIAHAGFILEKVHAAREFNRRINEQDLVAYVKDYLDSYWPGHDFRQTDPESFRFEIRLPSGLAAQLHDFVQARKLFGQTRLTEGRSMNCEFANKVQTGRAAKENLNQFHPLIRFISDDLKRRGKAHCSLVSMELPKAFAAGMKAGVYAFALQSWSFSGLREEEELQVRVAPLGKGKLLDSDESWKLVSCARTSGRDWLGAANEIDLSAVAVAIDLCAETLQFGFERTRREKENENLDRVAFQAESANRHLERQLEIQSQILATHRAKGNLRMIPLTEARVKKIRERFEVQEARLREKEKLRASPTEVSFGVIRVC